MSNWNPVRRAARGKRRNQRGYRLNGDRLPRLDAEWRCDRRCRDAEMPPHDLRPR